MVDDASKAVEAHVQGFFAGHVITRRRSPYGPVKQRIPGVFIYAAAPGPRPPGWSYLTAGCWKATAQHQHGLKFVQSTKANDHRHIELLTKLAHHHAGPATQRPDLGPTVPMG